MVKFKCISKRLLGGSLVARSGLPLGWGMLQTCSSLHLFMGRHSSWHLHSNPSRQPLVLKRAARCAQRCQKFFGALKVPALIQCARVPKIFATNRQSPSFARHHVSEQFNAFVFVERLCKPQQIVKRAAVRASPGGAGRSARRAPPLSAYVKFKRFCTALLVPREK